MPANINLFLRKPIYLLGLFIFASSLSSCTFFGLFNSNEKKLLRIYHDERSRYVYVQGHEVHYRDEGQGEVILLLHNELGSLHGWDVWAETLKEKYRVIRLDFPGFGFTKLSGKPDYSAENMSQFVDKFASELSLEKFILVGASYGGYIAWNYNLRHPEKVSKLVLLSPMAYRFELPFLGNVATWPIIGSIGRFITPKSLLKAQMEFAWGVPERLRKSHINRYHHFLMKKGNRKSMLYITRKIAKKRRTRLIDHQIKQIETDILLMWGGHDRISDLKQAHRWKQLLPETTLMIYPGVGHLPQEEIGQITADDMLSYLKGELVTFSR